MDLRKLQRIIIDALEDIKGQDIRVYDTTPITSLFDRVVIVSGTSNRQTRSMASHVRDKVKQAGGDVISVEGEETGEWVLVDLGDAVVHVMQPAIRAYYNLEELWGGKPVRVKLGGASAPAQAHDDDATDDAAAPTGKVSAPKRRATASKPAAAAAAEPARAARRTGAAKAPQAAKPTRTPQAARAETTPPAAKASRPARAPRAAKTAQATEPGSAAKPRATRPRAAAAPRRKPEAS